MSIYQTSEYALVKEFYQAFGFPVPDKPTELSIERKALRKKLLEEEIKELCGTVNVLYDTATIVDILNELSDIKYICYGTLIEMGYEYFSEDNGESEWLVYLMNNIHNIAIGWILETDEVFHQYNIDSIANEAFKIVHECNMQKLHNGKPIYREDGKILKPEGWVGPKEKIELLITSHHTDKSRRT